MATRQSKGYGKSATVGKLPYPKKEIIGINGIAKVINVTGAKIPVEQLNIKLQNNKDVAINWLKSIKSGTAKKSTIKDKDNAINMLLSSQKIATDDLQYNEVTLTNGTVQFKIGILPFVETCLYKAINEEDLIFDDEIEYSYEFNQETEFIEFKVIGMPENNENRESSNELNEQLEKITNSEVEDSEKLLALN